MPIIQNLYIFKSEKQAIDMYQIMVTYPNVKDFSLTRMYVDSYNHPGGEMRDYFRTESNIRDLRHIEFNTIQKEGIPISNDNFQQIIKEEYELKPKKCICSLQTIMISGCKCGGI